MVSLRGAAGYIPPSCRPLKEKCSPVVVIHTRDLKVCVIVDNRGLWISRPDCICVSGRPSKMWSDAWSRQARERVGRVIQ